MISAVNPLATTWVGHTLHEQKRGLAKLLATENLTVRHEQSDTAYFDVKQRTLILPLWENLTLDQYDLLIGHEVGHAKYTPCDDALFAELASDPNLKTFVNVLEDARIERLMQAAYPGLRPAFRRGYADFYAKGPLFQRDTLRSFDTYALIDRLNLHFKIGGSATVPFSPDEQRIVDRASRTQTFTDVVALARELYQASKSSSSENAKSQSPSGQSQKGQNRQNGRNSQNGQNGQNGQDGQNSQNGQQSSSGQDSQNGQDGQNASGQDTQTAEKGSGASQDARSTDQTTATPGSTDGVRPGDPHAETDVQATDALRSFTQQNQSSSASVPQDVVFPSATRAVYEADGSLVPVSRMHAAWQRAIARGFSPDVAAMGDAHLDARLAAFDRAYGGSIALLAQEFTRKQSAKLREKSRIAKTGILNPTKLHAYRLREDLFRQVRTLPKGKQHGLVVLIDGSGSMVNALADVFTQALFLAAFASRVRIPCIIAMFGNAEASLLPDAIKNTYTWEDTRDTGTGVPTIAPESPQHAQLKIVWDSTDASVSPVQQRRYLARLLTHAEFRVTRRSRYLREETPAWAAAAGYRMEDVSYLSGNVPGAAYGSTPLVSGAVTADVLLRSLHTTHRVQKSTLVVLTDGGASDGVTILHSRSERAGSRRVPCVIRDPQSRRVVSAVHPRVQPYGDMKYESSAEEQLRAIYDIYRSRYGTRIVGLGIVPSKGTALPCAVESQVNTMGVADWHVVPQATGVPGEVVYHTQVVPCHDALNLDAIVQQIRTTGLAPVTVPRPLYDGAVLLGSDALALDDDAFGDLDTSAMTTAQILRAFKKTQSTTKTNRRFVHTIVPYLA